MLRRAALLLILTFVAVATPAHAGNPRGKAAAEVASQRRSASAPARPGKVRAFVRDTAQRLRGARQHAYMPLRPGQTRVVDSTSKIDGATHRTRQVERVTEVRREKGLLRAQVESSWGAPGGQTTTTRNVVEVGRRGVRLSFAERLDGPARGDVRTSGVGLPRRLRVGKTWTNRMSSNQDGYRTEWESTSRVTGKLSHRGRDGKRRPGFVIESVTHTSTRTPDGQIHRSTMRTRAVHVKGLGEVESTSTVDGQQGTMLRRLVE